MKFSIRFLLALTFLLAGFSVSGQARADTMTANFPVEDAYLQGNLDTFQWTATVPPGTSLTVEARFGNIQTPDGTWTAWEAMTNGKDLSGYNYRYIQYRTIFDSGSTFESPVVEDIGFTTVKSNTLRSSVFDSQDDFNQMKPPSWTEDLPGSTDVLFQLRTSPDGVTWSNWCGPDDGFSDSCSDNFFTDPSGGETVDDVFADRSDDRYFQYQIILVSDGSNAPTVSSVNAGYDLEQSDPSLRSKTMEAEFPVEDSGVADPFYESVIWTADLPSGTAMQVEIHCGDVATPDESWSAWQAVSNEETLSFCDGDQYFQYRVTMGTDDMNQIPVLYDIGVNVNEFTGLTSSPYNSQDSQNKLQGAEWNETETLPADSQVKLSLRSATDEASLSGASWQEIASSAPGSLTSGCSKSGTAVTCDDSVIPSAMKDGSGDQWFQYKLELITGDSPVDVSDITINYLNAEPEITNITSDAADGPYKVGDTIDIDLTFSENVTTDGSATVTLETGDDDRTCSFSVTDSSTATCDYTVQEGDETADLNVKEVSGVIKDQVNLEMIDFTPQTNLTDNKDIQIDGVPPEITGITSDKPDGDYKEGEDINITLTFSEVVTSSTGLTVNLDTGGSATIDSWATATDTAAGIYTVGAGEDTQDLNVTSVTGTVSDVANDVVDPALPSDSNLSDNKNLQIDNTAPSSSVTTPDGVETQYASIDTLEGTASDLNLDTIEITIQDTDTGQYWTGSGWGAQTWLPAAGTTGWSYDASSVAWIVDNHYTVISRATDQAGNQEVPGSGNSFQFINSAPQVTLNSASKSAGEFSVSYDVIDTESASTNISLVYSSGATLTSSITDSATTIPVSDTANLPDSGTILLEHTDGDDTRYEYLTYIGKTDTTLTGATRGAEGTNAFSHASGVTVRVKASTLSGDSGEVENGAGKSLVWDADADTSFYSSALAVSVVSNDGASANKMNIATSASMEFDTQAPAINSATLSATTSPATLSFDVTDDTALEMKVSLNSDLSGAGWQSYQSSFTISLDSHPDSVYVQFQDAQQNTTAIQTLSTPETPQEPMTQDISNVSITPSEYRLFVSWGIIATPADGFGSYQIYHSTDGSNYSLEDTITDINENYYSDTGLAEGATHYYKILAEDAAGNQSQYSQVVYGVPNGIQDSGEGGGGEETTPPSIFNVQTSQTTATTATITWDTDELSDSKVEYITSTGGDFTDAPFQGVSSMVDNPSGVGEHQVTLSDLTPGTTYYFQVKSTDVSANSATAKDGTDGYSFTTPSGAAITGTAVESVTNTTAIITWSTDQNSDSYVTYSPNADLSSSTQVGHDESVTDHQVELTGLNPGSQYYFFVESGNAQDKNIQDGMAQYYTLTTTSDTREPTITFNSSQDVATDINSATIEFTTDEFTSSAVQYGTTTSYGSSESNSSYNTDHHYTLSGLASGETYHFQLEATDQDGNTATAGDYTFTTVDEGDITPPAISSIMAITESTTATIIWQTDENANSLVDYSQTQGSYTQTAGSENSSTQSHSVEITNLTPGVTYYFRLRSKDSSGNEKIDDNSGSGYTLTTQTSPSISSVSTQSLTDTSAEITFQTDQSAYGYVDYGETTSYGQTKGKEDNTYQNHSITLQGLTPDTQYHYRPRVKDVYGNYSIAQEDYTFTTDSSDAPSLQAFSSTTEDGLYKEGDSINLTAEYSQEIASGEITVKLDTGAEVTLSNISSTQISGTYTVSSGENSQDLNVEEIQIQNICNQNGNCQTGIDLPTSNISDTSDIQIDTGTPEITNISPQTDSTIDNVTDASDISYSLSEDCQAGTITFTRTGGEADSNSPHSYTLQAGELTQGEHNNLNTGFSLTTNVVYTMEVSVTDSVGNSTTETVTGITFGEDIIAPEISGISHTTQDTSATISWTTNEPATSRVEFGTDKNFSQNEENTELTTDHSLTLSDLEPNQAYYYRVISADAANNSATDDNSGAGYVLVTSPEEEDEEGPEISGVEVADLSYNSATVEWETGESANSLVDYGIEEGDYTKTQGIRNNFSQNHSVILENLNPLTTYYFQVSSYDQNNNLSTDDNSGSSYTFTTLSGSQDKDGDGEGDQITDIAQEINQAIENQEYTEAEIQQAIANIQTVSISGDGPDHQVENNTDAIITWESNKPCYGKIAYKQTGQDNYTKIQENADPGENHQITLKNLTPGTEYTYYVISESLLGNQAVSEENTFQTGDTPKISGISIEETSLNEAVISWTTNSITTSTLQYGVDNFDQEQEETSSTQETDHRVTLSDLEEGQEYQFRIKGEDQDGETTTSNTNTFTTSAPPQISNLQTTETTEETATINWQTNSPTDSRIEYSFQGEEEGTSQGVLEATTDHEIILENLTPGVSYQARVYSTDQYGNQAQSETFTFQTPEDNNPPQMQRISSETTIFPGEQSKIQTILSWITNKESVSAVAYRRGITEEVQEVEKHLQDKALTQLDKEGEEEDQVEQEVSQFQDWQVITADSFTKNHIFVVTDFEPGSVYQFKAVSADKRGNLSTSANYSFLTPEQQESVFDLIIQNFQEVFGWVGNMR